MNTSSKPLLVVSAAVLLGGTVSTPAEAGAEATAGQAPDAVVHGRGAGGRSEGQPANRAHQGSIKVTADDKPILAAAAKIRAAQAATIAEQTHPGTVVETKLVAKNGYLVWKVDLIDEQGAETQLRIDAGNGQVLGKRPGHKSEGRESSRDGPDEDADDESQGQ